MTIMTPIEGITAPAIPAIPAPEHDPLHPAIPLETFLPQDETPLLSSRRADGWSAANQRLFLECIAEGHGVEAATYRVGLSAASAYAFRRTAKGAAFALGWRAANLVARDAIAETLLVRALEGQYDTVTRADGSTVTRHRHDNRLAMSLLARLDRQVEAAPDADVKAARLVAQEFDAFLDLVAKDEGPARAGLFLARRCGGLGTPQGSGARDDDTHDLAPIYALAAADRFARTGLATAQDVDVSDLDPAARTSWTADQWQRAEAAGICSLAAPAPAADQNPPASQHSQHSPQPEDEDAPVRWDQWTGEYRTSFPPPDDFDGEEHGEYGHIDYERTLSPSELAAMGGDPLRYDEEQLAEQAEERDQYFSALAVALENDEADEKSSDDLTLPVTPDLIRGPASSDNAEGETKQEKRPRRCKAASSDGAEAPLAEPEQQVGQRR